MLDDMNLVDGLLDFEPCKLSKEEKQFISGVTAGGDRQLTEYLYYECFGGNVE